ncbi:MULTISPECIES: hypothetical protein [Pseudoalteromonas]|uniref:Uncharacterized protein n=1 Tax=Pseudoalteromonas amylolytica TaxID=1859457 RepID=A0A1S1MSH2_9GAMM|nr:MULTISPECIES: hypothetical protein [Pseudoalteromonas]OHU85997.1 hypothetical protein BFC16_17195 [Pseudoalteromonas sp. JW3]OHU89393.1 hypothetical protein BET10_17380 [Pseudoalteromonas amylolytica]
MTYSFKFTTTHSISLQEFIENVAASYDGPESLTEHNLHYLAMQLQLLANNKYFLSRIISEHVLQNALSVETGNVYGNDSFVLYVNRSPFFQVRVCFWHPDGEQKRQNDKMNVYQCLHDHNFGFLTTNYYGPGYISRFYQYQYRDELDVDCASTLKFCGMHQLSKHEVIFYEPSKDAHLQVAPSAFSISLNLMFETNTNKQFIFDPSTGRIIDKVISSSDKAQQFIKELSNAT